MKKDNRKYVDGFVIPIKKDKVAAYKKMASLGAQMCKKYGAVEYFECLADDLVPKNGMSGLGFSKMAKLKPDETLVFSWVIYKSKAHRDQVNKKMMSDPSMKDFDMSSMPFDMKRFAAGGFKPFVSF